MQKMNEIKNAITAASDIIIITHVNPDGDAIGSSLALQTALKKLRKQAVCVCDGKVMEKYFFLEPIGRLEAPEDFDRKFELAIAIDCADKNRMGKAEKIFCNAGKSINIDHHNTNEGFGDINLISNVSSSGELIFELIEALETGFDPGIAECLYTAMSTDTGNFTYSNTSKKALQYTSSLISLFDFAKIADLLYRTRTYENTLLIAKAIDNMTLHENARIALIALSKSDLESTGIKSPDYEMLVNYASEINTVKIAIFLRELKDGGYKISLRSMGELDVASLAASYNGGGHKNAAGCMMNAPLEEVKEAILADAAKLLNA